MTTRQAIRCLGASLAMVYVAGCASPMEQQVEEQVRQQMLESHRAYLRATAGAPSIEVTQPKSNTETELTPQRREQLDRMGGPQAYMNAKLDVGQDLLGKLDQNAVSITLQRCIELTVRNNLDAKLASLQPAISQTRITQAEANFDAEFFITPQITNNDTVRPPLLGGVSAANGSQQSDTRELATGIRKKLTTGGQMRVQTTMTRRDDDPSFYRVRKWYEADVSVTLQQPLLRNFGSDVSTAEISLAQSAQASATQDFKRELLTQIADTEESYWNLVFARQRYLIQVRLFERTAEDRERLRSRAQFDASPLRLSEASTFLEIRRADVVRAAAEVRAASDRLKRLINDPNLPLSGETLLVPLDWPTDDAVTFNLLDAVTAALRNRPELQRLLLEIRDAGTRLRVADNQRLPELNLEGTLRYNGLDAGDLTRPAGVDRAYDDMLDGKYIDYIIGGQFSMPIGNRGPEALFEQRKLERRAAIMNYRRGAQQVVLDIKDTLRNIEAQYRIVSIARAARLAASDSLRVIQEQEDAGVALTPEFLLDLKLNAQQRLADTETQEARALTDYNTAITRFYQAQGTLLQRNGIDFKNTPATDDNYPHAKKDPLGLVQLFQYHSDPNANTAAKPQTAEQVIEDKATTTAAEESVKP